MDRKQHEKLVVDLVDKLLSTREDMQTSVITSVITTHMANGNYFPVIVALSMSINHIATMYVEQNGGVLGQARSELVRNVCEMLENSYNDEAINEVAMDAREIKVKK